MSNIGINREPCDLKQASPNKNFYNIKCSIDTTINQQLQRYPSIILKYCYYEINLATHAFTKFLLQLQDNGHQIHILELPDYALCFDTVSIDSENFVSVINSGIILIDTALIQLNLNFPWFYITINASPLIIDDLKTKFENILFNDNPYKGKLIQFSNHSLAHFPLPKVSLDSIIIEDNIKTDFLTNSYDLFLNSKYHEYIKQRGIILYGPPGNGKSSLISGLLTLLENKNITRIVFDSSIKEVDISELFNFINTYLSPALLIFEDIDLIAQDRERHEGNNFFLGILLNALDGIVENKGPLVIIATTNRLELLDKAIARPCRFDRKYFIDYPSLKNLYLILSKISGIEFDKLPQLPINVSDHLTGAHVTELWKTANILALQQNKSVKDCFIEACDIIKSKFSIITPVNNVGFKT